ncbi:MAG: hypothetical protein AB7U29_17325 [Desulfobulbus sp.]
MFLIQSPARADLSNFLQGLNTQANADAQDYQLRLSAQFGVSLPEVRTMMRSVAVPADAFMCLQLGQMLGMPPQRVLYTYNQNRGRGWGVIAQSLGIKPGSAEFHALKQGKFSFTGAPAGYAGYASEEPGNKEHGKGKGKGKGHNK